MDRPRRRFPVIVAAGVTAAYAWLTAGLRPFTWPALVAVGVGGVAAIVLGTRRGPRSESSAEVASGALAWVILWAMLAAWELGAYLQHPRTDHPTLSALADEVLRWRPSRALAFLAWLAVGTNLARR